MITTRASGDAFEPIAEPQPGDIVAKRYRVDRVLGVGGMGVVFVAENLRTGREVALKWVPAAQAGEDGLARFVREARVAGRVQHPNVIDVYDVIEEGPAMFLVMELLRGEPLSALLEREGPLSPADAAAITIEALRGVSAVHAAGVIHRDIKPDNLFLCRDGKGARVKVLDFGVSKPMDGEDLSLTQTGAVVGTPYYMAPEQVRGARDLDGRIDTYALGAILYQMLSGQMPFQADSLGALAIQIATIRPTPLSDLRTDLDPALQAVVEKAMAREREKRFIDAAAFARELEPFSNGVQFDEGGADWTGRIALQNTPSLTPAISSMAPTAAESQIRLAEIDEPVRRNWPIIAGVLLIAAAGALGWFLTRAPVPETESAPTVTTETGTETTETETARVVETETEAVVETATDSTDSTDSTAMETATAIETTAEMGTDSEGTGLAEESPVERQTFMMTRMRRTMRGTPDPHRAGDLTLDDF